MSKFWQKFDDLMDSIPDYIEEQMDKVGEKFSGSSSISTTIQNGNKIVVKTVKGKTTVTVNGKEYVPRS